MGRISPRRVGVSFALAALVFVGSYIAQRLWAAGGGAVDARQVIAAAHIPYFDRLRLAAAHAVMVVVVAGMGLSERATAMIARALPAITAVIVLAAVVAAVLVP